MPSTDENGPTLLTGAQAIGARLGISARSAQALHQQGLLPTFRVGGTPYATVAALEDWLILQRSGSSVTFKLAHSRSMTDRLYKRDHRSYQAIMPVTLSRGDIVAVSKVPNDVLTFWIRQGLIMPIESGEGAGRNLRFKRHEAQIAALLVQGRRAGLNVDALRALSAAARAGYSWIEENGATKDYLEFLFDEQARDLWLEYGPISDESREKLDALVRAFEPIADGEKGTMVLSLLSEDWIIALYRSEDDGWYVAQIAEVEQLKEPFCIVFDLGQILAPLVWTKGIGSSQQERGL